jgi:hypothetical protein
MKFNRNYITPFIALVFLVVTISGLLMYFHLLDGFTEVVHENLGVAFIIFAIFHILVNWRGLKTHFGKKVFLPAAVAVLLISATFVILQRGSPPLDTLIVNKIVKAPINEAFRALNVDYDRVSQTCKSNGINIRGSKTIEEIWIKNDVAPEMVIDLIVE